MYQYGGQQNPVVSQKVKSDALMCLKSLSTGASTNINKTRYNALVTVLNLINYPTQLKVAVIELVAFYLEFNFGKGKMNNYNFPKNVDMATIEELALIISHLPAR